MIQIELAPFLKPAINSVKLHCLQCKVKVEKENPDLRKEVEKRLNGIQQSLTIPEIAELTPNKFTRVAYKSLGKDPSRYRPSAESLLRRVLKDKGLYQVNNVVDMINLISVSSGYSIGGYDEDKINGQIVLKKGGREPYAAIGRGELNIENLPVLYDEAGPFGSPTSDSYRTSIDMSTSDLLLVFFDFQPQMNFEEMKEDVIGLLEKYATGSNFVYAKVDG